MCKWPIYNWLRKIFSHVSIYSSDLFWIEWRWTRQLDISTLETFECSIYVWIETTWTGQLSTAKPWNDPFEMIFFLDKILQKIHGQGRYLLPMHNHPLVVAQKILDSSALDVLECSIFFPKPSHETTLSRPLSRGEKVGGFKSAERSEKGSKNRKWPFLHRPANAHS